ncbi:hypothetical protein HDV04_005735 [Boothiomyces sp. JEL0838]|nr:hypothetical protein HDV04_005735 [Boothiomyces sp. JEL0838]
MPSISGEYQTVVTTIELIILVCLVSLTVWKLYNLIRYKEKYYPGLNGILGAFLIRQILWITYEYTDSPANIYLASIGNFFLFTGAILCLAAEMQYFQKIIIISNTPPSRIALIRKIFIWWYAFCQIPLIIYLILYSINSPQTDLFRLVSDLIVLPYDISLVIYDLWQSFYLLHMLRRYLQEKEGTAKRNSMDDEFRKLKISNDNLNLLCFGTIGILIIDTTCYIMFAFGFLVEPILGAALKTMAASIVQIRILMLDFNFKATKETVLPTIHEDYSDPPNMLIQSSEKSGGSKANAHYTTTIKITNL